MLRNVKDLLGFGIRATDGVIGTVDDLYFDDQDWTIRYFVVNTGSWLTGRKVLVSPIAISSPAWITRVLPAALTKAQVEHSPDIDTRKPVSRQNETEYLGYYGYSHYWGGSGMWGLGAYPGSLTTDGRIEERVKGHRTPETPAPDDSHLRSSNTVIGHHIEATDGNIGHVEDLILDDHTWTIRYLIVDTSNWWGGQRVLVATRWIENVSWAEAKIWVDLTRQAVKDAPPYDSAAPLDRQQEQDIHKHYDRPGYWTAKASRRHSSSKVRRAGRNVHQR